MRYGLIGTSWITESFIAGAGPVGGMELRAVYSRSAERAASFARKHGAALTFTDLQAMAACPDIDAVYIASPNVYHASQSRLFLEHGKHVLCEKPITVTADQARELVELARSRRLVYMEAIMMLHQPARKTVLQALGELGRITTARFDFSQFSSRYAELQAGKMPNIFNPALAAGCLMDLGVYCVYPALDFWGEPERIQTTASFLSTGADGWDSAIFSYPELEVSITCSKVGQSRLGSEILGDKGTLVIDSISKLTGVRLIYQDGREETLVGQVDKAVLMGHEALDFRRYAEDYDGLAEERQYAEELSISVSRIMGDMRRQAGIRFADDEGSL